MISDVPGSEGGGESLTGFGILLETGLTVLFLVAVFLIFALPGTFFCPSRKALNALPRDEAACGSFPGPKTRSTITTIIASSGAPIFQTLLFHPFKIIKMEF